jgi:hypothetical protein
MSDAPIAKIVVFKTILADLISNRRPVALKNLGLSAEAKE